MPTGRTRDGRGTNNKGAKPSGPCDLHENCQKPCPIEEAVLIMVREGQLAETKKIVGTHREPDYAARNPIGRKGTYIRITRK